MDRGLREALLCAWRSIPEEVRQPPATEEQLRSFEGAFGIIPSEFRWFLAECGGGPVGSDSVDGIRELPASHRKFRAEFGPGGWSMKGVFIIGWDGAGNPLGILRVSGAVLVEDHNFGGVHALAGSFISFLAAGLGVEV
jgi:hypothetical protein